MDGGIHNFLEKQREGFRPPEKTWSTLSVLGVSFSSSSLESPNTQGCSFSCVFLWGEGTCPLLKQVLQLQPALRESEGKVSFGAIRQADRHRWVTSGHSYKRPLALTKVQEKHCELALPREIIQSGMSETLKICVKNVFLSDVRLATSSDFLCCVNAFSCPLPWELKMIL